MHDGFMHRAWAKGHASVEEDMHWWGRNAGVPGIRAGAGRPESAEGPGIPGCEHDCPAVGPPAASP